MKYLTIDAEIGCGVEVEVEIKRSRFITRLRRVATEKAARGVIEETRSTYYDATHNCTAFILGCDGRIARSSDDGEPAGTAGIPMLTALQHNHLSDVVAVVTRYFGGIKLGAGGLVRAYSEAVLAAISEAGKREVRLMQLLSIDVGYEYVGSLENQLRSITMPSRQPITVLDVTWDDSQAHLSIGVAVAAVDEFHEVLRHLSGGSLNAVPVGEQWVG